MQKKTLNWWPSALSLLKHQRYKASPIKIWLELIDLVGIVFHVEPVKLRDLVAGINTLWYGPWLCPGWFINGETAGLFNLYQLIFYLDIYFSVLFSCFVMQSLKLHVLSLTKNIDDLKLQLVSYLLSVFHCILFFTDNFCFVILCWFTQSYWGKLCVIFLIQDKDKEANNVLPADALNYKLVSHLIYLFILCSFTQVKL